LYYVCVVLTQIGEQTESDVKRDGATAGDAKREDHVKREDLDMEIDDGKSVAVARTPTNQPPNDSNTTTVKTPMNQPPNDSNTTTVKTPTNQPPTEHFIESEEKLKLNSKTNTEQPLPQKSTAVESEAAKVVSFALPMPVPKHVEAGVETLPVPLPLPAPKHIESGEQPLPMPVPLAEGFVPMNDGGAGGAGGGGVNINSRHNSPSALLLLTPPLKAVSTATEALATANGEIHTVAAEAFAFGEAHNPFQMNSKQREQQQGMITLHI
jgi:hypothetical protein